MLAEMIRSPIRNGQTPEAWLLWRSKVSEGMSEVDAWRWVEQESNIVQQAEVQSQVQVSTQQPTHPQSYPQAQAQAQPVQVMAQSQSISPVQHYQQLQTYQNLQSQHPQHVALRQVQYQPQQGKLTNYLTEYMRPCFFVVLESM